MSVEPNAHGNLSSQPAPDRPRGRLKVLLGAAPGVGKTYEMLLDAKRRQKDGVDVVIGVVETHGRAETEALVEGFEVVPRRRIRHAEHDLFEMDIDAILARRPQLVLVDELAHTNAPGSRHPKRHLDVEDILTAGIDVFTTLNIQHVESLNDVVARITRVRVRETVPDAVLDRADDIEVVDISPGDLIQRLQEGKVYVPDTAQRALGHYFSPGNLTALRELALRRTAQRVDEQLLAHMQSHAIAGPWAAGERVLVCINEDPRCAGIVRTTKRIADKLHAPWIALYVETARSQTLSEAERDRVADALRLAKQLGGDPVTVPGDKIVDEVLGYCAENNVTQIVIGKSDRSRWFEIVNGSVVHDLVRRAGAINVLVMAGEPVPEATAPPNRAATARQYQLRIYTGVVGAVAAALGVGLLMDPFAGHETADLIFLLAVIGVSITQGLVPSIVASVLASLAYNFFFLPPVLTFTIVSPANIVSFVFFLVVALVVSSLAARVHAQVLTARNRARTTEALYSFSRKIAAAGTLDDLLWATAYQMASMLKLDVVVLLGKNGQLDLRASYPPEDDIDEADFGAAKWANEMKRIAGRGSDTLPGARRLFLPLIAGDNSLGVVGLTRAKPGPLLTPDGQRLLDALIDQAAVAIERFALVQDMEAAKFAAETERLRSALLASLSHDLKTPLASILGAVTSLRQFNDLYDTKARDELAATIEDEAERLSRFVANLLDMTRLDSGAVEIERTAVDLGEVVATALTRVGRLLSAHKVETEIEPDLPFVSGDAVLLEQAMVNLLDNAAKYTSAGSTIRVRVGREEAGLRMDVIDQGQGIPEGEREKVFEKFHRAGERDHRRAGTGLGLSIARGFVEALGGSISVTDAPGAKGACFTIRLPSHLYAVASTNEAAE